jgi:endonuclease YncB( thermonuclease family)
MGKSLALIAALSVVCGLPCEAGEPVTGTCVEVVDGDTIAVAAGGAEPQVVHLADIDAPEIGQSYGEEARTFLSELALDQEVRVEGAKPDALGELTGRVFVGDDRLAKALLEAGLAWTLEAKDEELALASIIGRGSRLGLWQDPDPLPPWTWRAQQVQPTPTPRHRSLAGQAREADPSIGGPGRDAADALSAGAADIPAPGTTAGGGPWVDFAVTCAVDQIEVCARNAFVRFFPKVNSGDEAGEFAKKSAGAIKGTDSRGLPIRGRSTAGRPYAGWATWPAEASGTCRVTVRVPKL